MVSFWAVALVVPLLALLGNALLRWLCKLEQSSAADLILMFAVFDALVIIEHEEFRRYLSNEVLRRDIIAIYVMLLFVNFFLWIISAFYVEKKLSSAFDNRSKKYKKVPFLPLFGSYVISLFVFCSNLICFAYRG